MNDFVMGLVLGMECWQKSVPIRYRHRCQVYLYEYTMGVIDLNLRYGRSAAVVINEPDYPNRHTLRLRHREFA